MNICLQLTKKDIETCKMGHHYEIRANGVTINFTPDAFEELENDIKEIRKHESNENLPIQGNL